MTSWEKEKTRWGFGRSGVSMHHACVVIRDKDVACLSVESFIIESSVFVLGFAGKPGGPSNRCRAMLGGLGLSCEGLLEL